MNAPHSLSPSTIDSNKAAEPSDDDSQLSLRLSQKECKNEKHRQIHSTVEVRRETENSTTNKTAKPGPPKKYPRQRSRQNELSSSEVLREKYTNTYRNRAYGTGNRAPSKRTSHGVPGDDSPKEFNLSVTQVRRARLPRSLSKSGTEFTTSKETSTSRMPRQTRMDGSSKDRVSSTQSRRRRCCRRRRRRSPRSTSPRRTSSSSLANSAIRRRERCSRASKQDSSRHFGRSRRRSSHQQVSDSRAIRKIGSPPKLVSQSSSRRSITERSSRNVTATGSVLLKTRQSKVSSRRRISRSASVGSLPTVETTEESPPESQSRHPGRRNALDIQRSQVKHGLNLQDERNYRLCDSGDDKDDRVLRLMARLCKEKTSDKRHHSWPSRSNPAQEDEEGETSWTHFSSAVSVPKHLVTTAASATNHVAHRAVAGAQASANTAAYVAKATATSATYVAKATAVSAAHVLTGAAVALGVQQQPVSL